MSRSTSRLAAPAAAATAWAFISLLAGCSDNPAATDTSGVATGNSLAQTNLNQPYGGLAYTSEAPAFGDPALSTEASIQESAALGEDDEAQLASSDPTVGELVGAPRLRRTYLRVVWGMLDGPPDSSAAEVGGLDWTGSLRVSQGAIVVKHTILFDRRLQGDHLLPRTSRQEVDWVSHTRRHVDGILVCLLSKPDSTGAVHGTVTFQTPQLTKSFEIAQLDGLDETVMLDQLGNGVNFTAFAREPVACPSGFMAGHWMLLPQGNGGVFRGLWLSEGGRVRGFLMGRFGVNDSGEHIFAGKLIGFAGAIRGLVQGTYAPNADGTGTYEGRWVNRAGTIEGVLQGRFKSRLSEGTDFNGGFFEGRWSQSCDQPTAL
jgi:hypothetical protein